MKLSLKQLRNLINEEIKSKSGGVHLSTLESINPRAYEGWIEMLVEDCSDEFIVNSKKEIRVKTRNGAGNH